MYTDEELVEKCRLHAAAVRPNAPVDEQAIALLARLLKLALQALDQGYGIATLNQLLLHVGLKHVEPKKALPPHTELQHRVGQALEYLRDPQTDRHHDGDMVLSILSTGEPIQLRESAKSNS